MIPRPSPNHDARRAGLGVDLLLIHYTGTARAEESLERLCDPVERLSAHYLIDETGTVYALVAEDRRAWHAGVSWWAGESDINGCSIGIELANPGHEFGYRPFPEAQMAALEALAPDILARHAIPPRRVLGHSDVAPARKKDPGELFDWARLAARGIGLWPVAAATDKAAVAPLAPGDRGGDVAALQRELIGFGYGLKADGRYGAETECVVAAFQRHFRQDQVDGVADGATRAALAALMKIINMGT